MSELYARTLRLVGGLYNLNVCSCSSTWQRNRAFAQMLLFNLIPPLQFVYCTFKNPELERLSHKLQVCWVMFFYRYASALETLRLYLGRLPARV